MNNNGKFPITVDPFTLEADKEVELEDVWVSEAARLLQEVPDERASKVSLLRAAIASDAQLSVRTGLGGVSLAQSSEGLIVRFLRAAQWKVDEAVAILKAYTSLGQDYFAYVERSVPSELDCVWKAHLNTMCESRDKHGRRVYIFRLGRWDPDTIPVEQFYASAYVLLELMSREVKTQIAGITIVGDISGFSFKHIRNLGIEQLRLIAAFLTGAFPLWVHKIHVVNHPRIFNILFNMMKPILDDRVRNNITFHGSDVSSLHSQVDPHLLPGDLGGSGDLDNSAVVAVAKQLDDHFRELIQLART